MTEKKIDFEQQLERLKTIVSTLENESLSLDESLKLYEEGKKIVELLEKELDKSRAKIETILNK